MEKNTATDVACGNDFQNDLEYLVRGIAFRNKQDEGDLYSIKISLLPEAFKEYFSSDTFSGKSVYEKKEAFQQYDWLQFTLRELLDFIKKHDKEIAEL